VLRVLAAALFHWHRLLIRRFPFALSYLLKEISVDIYAIRDCRRDPNLLPSRPGGTGDLA
jgi:hypothetical protein